MKTPNTTTALAAKIATTMGMASFLAVTLGGGALSAQAASTIPAQHGVNIQSASPTDFASAGFLQTLQNLKADHASGVFLVIPLAQSNIYSSDVRAAYGTPTDAALITAIQEAHSLGLTVTLKPHLDPQDGNWRAFIDASDRSSWYTNYGNIMQHYATLAQANGVEQFVVGTELIYMASGTHNASNTAAWTTMIAKIRTAYSGKLSYAANWGPAGSALDEKNQIGFWNKLDFAGVDAYYPIASSNSVEPTAANFIGALQQTDLAAFTTSVGIPVIITELGYRSANGTITNPGDYQLGYGVNTSVQANAYQAAFSYISGLSNVAGVYMWDWKSNPYAGGSNDNDYTPQGKPAETVMSTWFNGQGNASTGTSPTILQPLTATAAIPSTSGVVNSALTITTNIANVASYAQTNVIIDTEVYDQNGTKVFQKFSEGQNLGANAVTAFQNSWTPTSAGTYSVKVGVFAPGWSQSLVWNNAAATYTVTAASVNTSGTPMFSSAANAVSGTVNNAATLMATVGNAGAALANSIVDLELYDVSGKQIAQKFMSAVSFATGSQQQFQLQYTPTAAGTYRLTVGVFNNDWSKNYFWNNQAALLTVTTQTSTQPVATTTTPVATTTPVTTTPVATTTPVTATSTTPVATTTPVTVPPVATTTTPIATTTTPVATTTPVVPPVVTPTPVVATGTVYPGTQTGRAGTGIDFSGRNFGHEETVVITTSTGKLGQAHADGGGNFTTGSLGLPSTPGTYTVTFTGQTSGIIGISTITLTQ